MFSSAFNSVTHTIESATKLDDSLETSIYSLALQAVFVIPKPPCFADRPNTLGIMSSRLPTFVTPDKKVLRILSSKCCKNSSDPVALLIKKFHSA